MQQRLCHAQAWQETWEQALPSLLWPGLGSSQHRHRVELTAVEGSCCHRGRAEGGGHSPLLWLPVWREAGGCRLPPRDP